MPIEKFPDPREATPEGILALGGDLAPESLLLAYRSGIFPWPMPLDRSGKLALAWFCPPRRAVLEFERLHIPRSLERQRRKTLASGQLQFTIDRDFQAVIRACAAVPRPGQPGTWITRAMEKAYVEFHHRGHAHSVEVWEGPRLVGGIYGVDCGGAFAGESMFYTKPYASKLALMHLIDHLRARGLEWIDIQMLTPHMEALGAREISREAFLKKLARTLKQAPNRSSPLFDPR